MGRNLNYMESEKQTIQNALEAAVGFMLQEHYPHADKLLWLVLDSEPDNADAWNLLAMIAHRSLRHDMANVFAQRGLALRSDVGPFWSNYASICLALERPEEAIGAAETAIALSPDMAEANFNLACAYYHLSRMHEAIPYFEKTLKLNPALKRAAFFCAMAYLAVGRWKEGWKGFEIRFDPSIKGSVWLAGNDMNKEGWKEIPTWNGTGVLNKKVIVWAEQGYGDQFMFARYLPILRGRGATVKVVCSKEMSRIMMTLADEVYESVEEAGEADYQCPIIALPALLGLPIPFQTRQYLPCRKVAQDCLELKVGLCWQGSKKHSNDRNRSFTGNDFGVFEMEGVSLVSLTKEEDGDESIPINRVKDWADTATLIEQLDLVITVDTAVGHLAAAMGKAVWIILPIRGVDWRWGTEGEDSIWYENVTLFRGGKKALPEAAERLRQLLAKPQLVEMV